MLSFKALLSSEAYFFSFEHARTQLEPTQTENDLLHFIFPPFFPAPFFVCVLEAWQVYRSAIRRFKKEKIWRNLQLLF